MGSPLDDLGGTAILDATELLVLATAYAAGSIPFAQLAAKATRGTDLREIDTGTISGTNLYRVAGFGPLAIAGILDVAKGAVGPVLADDPIVAALAAGAAVAGHNWSPLLRFAGGRGISPAIGGLLVVAWPGAAVLLGGLAIGKLARRTGMVCFVSQVALVPVLGAWGGTEAAAAAAAVVLPMWWKRVVGNAPIPDDRSRLGGGLHRLVFDNDGEDTTGSPGAEAPV